MSGFDGALVFLFGEHLADAQSPRRIFPVGVFGEEFFQCVLVATIPPSLQEFLTRWGVEGGEEILVRSSLLDFFRRGASNPNHPQTRSHAGTLLEDGEHFGVGACLAEHSTKEFLGVGIGSALLDAEVPFHRLHPKPRRSLRIIAEPEHALVEGQLRTHGIQGTLGGKDGFRHDGISPVFDLPVAEFSVEPGGHRRERNLGAGEICRFHDQTFLDQLSHLIHGDRGAVGRKWHLAEPLRANQQKPECQTPCTTRTKNQALGPPGFVALRAGGGGISESQPSEDENPPTQFHAMDRHIDDGMKDCRQDCRNDSPPQRPGRAATEGQHVSNQHHEKPEGTEKKEQSRFAGGHQPVALGMNRNRFIDAGIDIKRDDIRISPKPRSRDRVVPHNFYGVAENLGSKIREGRAGLRFSGLGNHRGHSEKFQHAITGLAFRGKENPSDQKTDGEHGDDQRRGAMASSQHRQPDQQARQQKNHATSRSGLEEQGVGTNPHHRRSQHKGDGAFFHPSRANDSERQHCTGHEKCRRVVTIRKKSEVRRGENIFRGEGIVPSGFFGVER